MSGGFFRGTSSEQDTRFSNKQAKLMKSQKFAPELEHLVDMTKVKMDVMRPWIAKRVTELIGFEDEVVINFIYGLLEGKVVNGKEIQISLTGFMERNTGKFMKELWELLLSAQNNASGVPQQFLDAKEEETREKKAETDRIANEIQKKKERENPELDQEKRKMDNHANNVREKTAVLEPSSKHQARVRSEDDIDPVGRNGSRGRNRASRSPRSAQHSPLPRRSRSISKSFSNSRSYAGERRKSPSTSGSPKQRRGRSVSSERVYRSPVRVSFSPRRKHAPRRSSSPPRHRLRSTSRVRCRTPSPARYRRHSPFRRRSRSPIRRRSRSPMWRRSRSPRSSVRYRSRSPVRRGSPPSIRRRTPSSRQHRSPSPVRRVYHRSPSCPHSSPSPIKRKSPIFGGRRLLAPVKRRSASPVRRSLSPQGSRSPSPIHRRSPSPTRERTSKTERSLVQSPRGRMRNREKYSPVQHDSRAVAEAHKRPRSLERGRPISSRSPQRDLYDSKGSRRKELPSPPMRRQSSSVSESPRRFKSDSESPPAKRERSPSEERPRSTLNLGERKTIATSPRISRGHRVHVSERNADEKEKNHSREASEHEHRSSRRVPTSPDPYKDIGKGRDGNEVSEIQSRSDCLESINRNEVMKSEKVSGRTEHPKKLDQPKSPQTHRPSRPGKRERESYDGEISKANEETSFHTNDIKGNKVHVESETHLTSSRKVEQNDRSESGNEGFGSEETEKHSAKVKEKRKNRRSGRYESSSDDSYDSDVVDRKDAKRRKEERRLKKEEKRRRREERRRRKVERRAQKLKLKSANAISSPSDTERKFDGGASDDEHVRKEDPRGHEIEESVSLQKKLEVEMREKALESIRAKKGISR